MNPEMQSMLLNVYPPKLISMVLQAVRVNENDQLNAVDESAGPAPEIPS